MGKHRRGVGAAAAAVVLGLLGAGCKDDKPTAYNYVFRFPKDSPVPNGALVYVGDERLGSVTRSETNTRASFMVPTTRRLGNEADKFAIRFETPCGLSEPLPFVSEGFEGRENEWRGQGSHEQISFSIAELAGAPTIPEATRVWVDRRNKKPQVKVGNVALPAGKSHTLFALDCAPRHDVTVDGQKVGVLSSEGVLEAEGADPAGLAAGRKAAAQSHAWAVEFYDETAPRGHVFIGQPGACYRWEYAVYVKQSETPLTQGTSRILQGQRLYQLSSEPAHFLESAPNRQNKASGLHELVPIDCATKKNLTDAGA